MAELPEGCVHPPGGSFLFASDLHGREDRFLKLFSLVQEECPEAVFLGGDLLPSGSLLFGKSAGNLNSFLEEFLLPRLRTLRLALGANYPRVFLILGNDDPRSEEAGLVRHEKEGLWHYIHFRRVQFGLYAIYGYACVPPTPFLLKDWERYDVSRFVDPGSVPPEDGRFSVSVAEEERGFPTIQEDLARLTGAAPLDQAIFLFHSPPYQTALDRAALDGRQVDGAPLDVHVGSIAIRRFIEERQPLITLHGHVHESVRLTGSWQEKIGRTHCFSAAHDGCELAVVNFDPREPGRAQRRLL
ncbi:MAG: metallophosphoesterase [Acidobacteriota bacterium]|nr:metallophosphoesterase [Acidobacteriota bacterium]